MNTSALWSFLPLGYVFTVLVETPVLLVGLSRTHPFARKLFAGLWLTACTYPIVVLVMPVLIPDRNVYLVVAETFAPVAECVLFRLAFRDASWRDYAAIVIANLASFGVGLLVFGR